MESIRRLGDEAEKHGVKLVIENHFNTMTVSAKQSIDLTLEQDYFEERIYGEKTIRLAKHAERIGADGIGVVIPPFGPYIPR